MFASIRKITNIEETFERLRKYEKKDINAEEISLTDIERAPGSGVSGDLVAHQQGMCRCDGAGDYIIAGSIRNTLATSGDHPYFYVIENGKGSKKVNGKDYVTFTIDKNDHTKYTHPGGLQVAENVLAISAEDYIGAVTHTDRSYIKFYNIGDTSNIYELADWSFYRHWDNACASALGLIKTDYGQWLLAIRANNRMEFYATPINTIAGDNNGYFELKSIIVNDGKTNNLKNFQNMNLFFEKGSNILYLIGLNPEGAKGSRKDMMYLYRVNLNYSSNNSITGVSSITHLNTMHLYSATSAASFDWAACTCINEYGNFVVYDTTMHVDDKKIRMNRWDTGRVQNNNQPMKDLVEASNSAQFDNTMAALPLGSDRTIKLMSNITSNKPITLNNLTVTFDLNGKKLNIAPGTGINYGITLTKSHIKLVNPANGELNVNGTKYAINATNGSTAEVTTAGGGGGGGGGGVGSGGGAIVSGGSTITVHGSITAAPSSYIQLGNIAKTPMQYSSPTTKTKFLTYTDGSNTVWVKDIATGWDFAVLETGALYENIGGAVAAIPAGGSGTIKLLDNHSYYKQLNIIDKAIVLDLNGKTLNIMANAGGEHGIYASNGKLIIKDPARGKLYVRSSRFGIYASNKSTVEATDVYGCESNIYVTGGSAATVHDSARTIIGMTYIDFGDTTKTQAQFTTPTTKAGYLTYTDNINFVWAKEPAPVCMVLETGMRYFSFNINQAIDSVPVGSTRNIKLMASFVFYGNIVLNDKTIIFDLNGCNLLIYGGSSDDHGLYLSNAHVRLVDPMSGELNIVGSQFGVYAMNGSSAEVTNTGGEGGGVSVAAGSTVTVYGNITAFCGTAYVMLGGSKRRQAQCSVPTTNPEYVTYTDGTNTVWVNPVVSGNSYVVNKQSYNSIKDIVHHEMHRETCTYLPAPSNRLPVGLHPTPEEAIAAARVKMGPGTVIDGCYICCNEVHTM